MSHILAEADSLIGASASMHLSYHLLELLKDRHPQVAMTALVAAMEELAKRAAQQTGNTVSDMRRTIVLAVGLYAQLAEVDGTDIRGDRRLDAVIRWARAEVEKANR